MSGRGQREGPTNFAGALGAAIEDGLGCQVLRLRPVHGGDVAAAFRAELADGRTVFAKTHPSGPRDFFTTEAASLRWLREAEAVLVPEVLAVADRTDAGPGYLVLEWIDEGRASATTDADLGRDLAALHRSGAPRFGRDDRRTTGSRGLPNDPCATWSEFYASRRLLPLARLAREAAALPEPAIQRLERLAATLGRFEDGEPPSRLHGDLWAGNRLVDVASRSWLIDPAAHGGHREFDLAMMHLFGGFSSECFRSYQAVHALPTGWEERIPLHQIAPLVVHAIKFGGAYVGAAMRAIERY